MRSALASSSATSCGVSEKLTTVHRRESGRSPHTEGIASSSRRRGPNGGDNTDRDSFVASPERAAVAVSDAIAVARQHVDAAAVADDVLFARAIAVAIVFVDRCTPNRSASLFIRPGFFCTHVFPRGTVPPPERWNAVVAFSNRRKSPASDGFVPVYTMGLTVLNTCVTTGKITRRQAILRTHGAR